MILSARAQLPTRSCPGTVEQARLTGEQIRPAKAFYDPTITYSTGLPTADHSRFPDRTPEALATFDNEESADLNALRTIDPGTLPASSRATYANLKEQLESDLQLRVCKTELWNVNHSGGLEIKALREEAQEMLGNRFDLREFDRAVLEEGVVPLSGLRIHVEAWIHSRSPNDVR